MTKPRLDGRVAVVTGAGRGLGRSYALALAAHGASVIVNDLGADLHGAGRDASPAQLVVGEIIEGGGKAVVSGHDVADWSEAQALVAMAVLGAAVLVALILTLGNANAQRDRARAALGARFDLRDFNQAVVEGGNVPLDVLAGEVSRYIGSVGA